MEPREAAGVVQAMIDSLRAEPDQLHISISVSGQQVTSHGGTGLSITATGGGPGSTTVGQVITMNGSHIEISRGKADQAMKVQLTALINSLEEIAVELRSPRPDRSKIQRVIDSLKGTWVPGLIIGVMSNALSSAIGI